jgi:hypothetical protein
MDDQIEKDGPSVHADNQTIAIGEFIILRNVIVNNMIVRTIL